MLMTRGEYARLASDQVANNYDDKLDHLQAASEALLTTTTRYNQELDPTYWKLYLKHRDISDKVKALLVERHVAVKTAYDLSWSQYDAYRFQQRRIIELEAVVNA